MGENEELRQGKRRRSRDGTNGFTGAMELKTDTAASNSNMCPPTPTLPKKGKLVAAGEKMKQQTHNSIDTPKHKKHSMDLFANLSMAKSYMEKALTCAAAVHNLDSGGTQEMKKDQGSLLGCPCIQKNSQMNLELEKLKKELERCKNQNRVNQKKLSEENQELKKKLNEECNKNLKLKEQMNTHKMDEAQDEMFRLKIALDQMAGCNKYLMLREQKSTHKLDETNKELFTLKTKLHEMEENFDALNKQLEAKTDDMEDMESLIQVYVVKQQECNNVLQEAHKELISGWKNFLDARPMIGIKRMGELKKKPFQDVCMQKISNAEWDLKSAEQCSHWQERIEDPQWFPFKIIETNGKCEEIINENDDELKRLKNEWGNPVYEAVCAALAEVNEYNPSARYPVPELWNFREGRKAELKEAVGYLISLAKKQTCGVQQ